MPELDDPEDRKLVTLARATRARAGAAEGAALRDGDGRTYAAATVSLPSLQVSAVAAVIAMAVAAGARTVESVIVLTDSSDITPTDLDALRDLGGVGLPVHRCSPAGAVEDSVTT